MNATSLRAVVGVDLQPACEGALSWAKWLGEAHGQAEMIAVHAVQWHEIWEDVGVTAELVELATRDFLTERELPWEPRIFGERRPLDALGHAVGVHAADLLVIGRRAGRDDDRLIQLGRTARRLLRRLPCPVAVVPADLDPASCADGPILLAVEPDETCEGALAFARRFAASLGKSLLPVAALPSSTELSVRYLPTPSSTVELAARARVAVGTWLREHEVDEPPRFVEGPVVASLLDAVDELGASAIVVGSRMLSLTDRIVHTSVGSALAAVAPVPVIVVPPPTAA